MKKIITILFVSAFFINVCPAQHTGENEFYLNWLSGIPVGTNFLSQYSPRGFNFGYNRFVSDKTAVGFDMGWNNYYEYKARQTYQLPDGAATSDFYKYLYTLPMTLTVTQYFNGGKIATPYAKLGLGAQYSEQNLYYNVYETTNDNWGFVAIPEVGALFHFGQYSPWAAMVAVRYQFSTNSSPNFNITNVQTLNFLLGVICTFK